MVNMLALAFLLKQSRVPVPKCVESVVGITGGGAAPVKLVDYEDAYKDTFVQRTIGQLE